MLQRWRIIAGGSPLHSRDQRQDDTVWFETRFLSAYYTNMSALLLGLRRVSVPFRAAYLIMAWCLEKKISAVEFI